MREIVKFALIMGLVCALSAGTLSAVYSVVIVKIEENNRIEAERKRQAVLASAVSFEEVQKDGRSVYVGLDGDGSPVGAAMTVSKRGYGGPIAMTVGIGPDRRLTGLAISKLDQTETPGLGVKITFPAFLKMFAGKSVDELKLRKEGGEIDAITAATISSRAVVDGVVEGMNWYFENFPEGAAPAPTGQGGTAGEAVPEGGE